MGGYDHYERSADAECDYIGGPLACHRGVRRPLSPPVGK